MPQEPQMACKIELQTGVERLANLVQRDEQRHERRFFDLEHVRVRIGIFVLRIVAEDLEAQPA
jgi:hypothetical protein